MRRAAQALRMLLSKPQIMCETSWFRRAGLNIFPMESLRAMHSKHKSKTSYFRIAVFSLKVFHPLNARRFHATMLRFPFVVCGDTQTVFPTDNFHRPLSFHGFQNPHDLVLAEFRFARTKLMVPVWGECFYFALDLFYGGLSRLASQEGDASWHSYFKIIAGISF